MGTSINELLLKYARLGLRHWASESESVKRRARAIRIDIATQQAKAEIAVTNPYRPSAANNNPLRLIPMPCTQNRVYAAFFVPWISGANPTELCFDLVVLMQQGSPFAFRFEPASQYNNSAHGYDHVQMNQKLGRENVPLVGSLPHIPTTYPAFPIPSKDPATRFLAMAVAMHGYPQGVGDILSDVFAGFPNKRRIYLNMTRAMLMA